MIVDRTDQTTRELKSNRKHKISCGLLSLMMISMGALHIAVPAPFQKTISSFLPYSLALVLLSGLCEIAGGIGIQIPKTRKLAAYGLIALYIAVFPANVNMAIHSSQFGSPWILWLRLPFQIPLIWWAWTCRLP